MKMTKKVLKVVGIVLLVIIVLVVLLMDGAAMYDVNAKEYLEAEFLRTDICEQAENIISESGMHCFVNVMYDTTLLIFFGK